MIVFAYPKLFLLFLLPLLFFLIIPPKKQQFGDALSVPFLADLKKIKEDFAFSQFGLANKSFVSFFKFFYLFLIWALLTVAAARPQLVGEPYRLNANNRDIMLVIDISTSMLQPDFSTTTRRIDRLSAVKAVVSAFIQKRTEDKIGLVLFGTRAYLQSPLTFDRTSVQEILLNTDAGMAGQSTSIGDALGLALKNLRNEKNKENKVIILLSDGENNDGALSMAQAINLAEKEGIKVYTIGVGAEMNFINSLFGLRNNELDEKSLKALAQRTKGNYFRATDLNSLAEIYNRIDTLEPEQTEGTVVQDKTDLFYVPLLVALVLAFFFIFFSRSFIK